MGGVGGVMMIMRRGVRAHKSWTRVVKDLVGFDGLRLPAVLVHALQNMPANIARLRP